MNELNTALSYHRAGIAVIPIGAHKVPQLEWKSYISYGVTEDDVNKWFASPAGIGRLCGAISGNMEVIDFDIDDEIDGDKYGHTTASLIKAWGALVEQHAPGLKDRLCVIRTPRPGWHITYRCESPIGGNQKLAMAPYGDGKYKAVIETRGEGGYALSPGSPHWCHPKGGHLYQHVSGPALTDLPVITAAERDILLQAARSFSQKPEKCEREKLACRPTSISSRGGYGNDLSPGDDYISRMSWSDVLAPHGFELIETTADGVSYWRRAGSQSKWSASTNHKGTDLFYAWSPNCGVDADRGYSKFSIYTHLSHAGDFAEATRALASQGYGQKDLSHVDISGILGGPAAAPEVEKDEPFPAKLLAVPGIVAGLCEYAAATAFIPQPVLSLAASISFMGALIGRKVTDSVSSRANIYCLGVCDSGSGKDYARTVNKRIAQAAGCLPLIGPESIASGSGVVNAINQQPSMLMQIDEIGRLLKTVGQPGSSPHLYQIITVLMKLFSSSGTTYQGDAYAETKKNVSIDHPNLNIYGTTVPQSLFESITLENLTDGFMSRMLLFEGDSNATPQRPRSIDLPADAVQMVAQWHQYEQSELGAIYSHPLLVPYTEAAEQYMWEFTLDSSSKREGPIQRAMWSRAAEKARKLALIHACSESFEEPQIDLDTVEWACELSSYLTRRLIALSERHVSENGTEKNWKRLEDIIRKSGEIKATELHRQTRFLKSHERTSALKELEDKGLIVSGSVGSVGRPSKVYQWVKEE